MDSKLKNELSRRTEMWGGTLDDLGSLIGLVQPDLEARIRVVAISIQNVMIKRANLLSVKNYDQTQWNQLSIRLLELLEDGIGRSTDQ